MTDDEFAALVDFGAEQRNVEFKRAAPISDRHFVHRVARAVLGMTNRRDGGYVVIGVEEANGVLVPQGIDSDLLAGWTRDILADKLAVLVDPSVDFDLELRSYSGRKFVLLTVREFDETPVFCRTDKHDQGGQSLVLREGALYVRGRRKPETTEIRTSQEMRDLIEMAVRKRVRHLAEILQATGLSTINPPIPNDADKFRAQIADLEF